MDTLPPDIKTFINRNPPKTFTWAWRAPCLRCLLLQTGLHNLFKHKLAVSQWDSNRNTVIQQACQGKETLSNVCNTDEARRTHSWELSSGTPPSVFGRAQLLSPRRDLECSAGSCPQLSHCCRSAFSHMGQRYLRSSGARGTFPWVMLHNPFLWKGALVFWGPLGAYWCWRGFLFSQEWSEQAKVCLRGRCTTCMRLELDVP